MGGSRGAEIELLVGRNSMRNAYAASQVGTMKDGAAPMAIRDEFSW